MADVALENIAAEGGVKGNPMEVHLATLGTELSLPEAALTACVAYFEEVAERLRALLERAADGDELSDDEALRLFRGLHVLAARRDTLAYRPLLRLLRRPDEEVMDLLGDMITVSLPRLIISVFDGDAEPLLALVAEPTLDAFLRASALDAATYLAWERRLDQERHRGFLVEFHDRRLAMPGEFVWHAWMSAVALLDFDDLVPMVESAWKAGLIDKTIQHWSHFEGDLERARSAYDDADRFSDWQVGYVDDVAKELEWTRHSGEEAEPAADLRWSAPPATITNPFRNVGRNDPCPCGSGKKAKKCCLATH